MNILNLLKPNLTQFVTQAQNPAIDIWSYAQAAGEEPNPRKRNLLQWRRAISSVREPVTVFAGQPVDVVGFVHRLPTDGENQFTLARLVIRCCLNDALPLGLTVDAPKAHRYPSNSWLRIQGQLEALVTKEQQTLAIAPQKIKRISEPKKPYINGAF